MFDIDAAIFSTPYNRTQRDSVRSGLSRQRPAIHSPFMITPATQTPVPAQQSAWSIAVTNSPTSRTRLPQRWAACSTAWSSTPSTSAPLSTSWAAASGGDARARRAAVRDAARHRRKPRPRSKRRLSAAVLSTTTVREQHPRPHPKGAAVQTQPAVRWVSSRPPTVSSSVSLPSRPRHPFL